ncbi:sulfite exporter TauE/SafE family protein [Neptunicella marina]|uniref:Probable membrane transporter protein n=1 Tax=Neptunicella marina TaxID=2125989 RepID=A0A8J6IL79_9ALTE|nr:sulfite exporter TauE/SafE family protein [Neptunicella marina]MBC3764650.1 sulfite exporter TauE/SafE family protein [Neptunicella marina]
MSLQARPKQYLWVWGFWLTAFYLVWSYIVFGHDLLAVTLQHWPMAAAMAVGSYAAGSTPMGGGTVGFPVLVLLFELPASLGRDFSFAIQSIGMTSASIFILAKRQPLAKALLYGAMLGALIGTPLGLIFVAPYFSELYIKLVFAVIWASFGLLHLYRLDEIASHSGMTDFDESWDFKLGLTLGLLSAMILVSVTGVGIDMVLYTALVLLCRADLKIAIPTSVVIMAFTSVVGVMVKTISGSWQDGVFENWLAAAPVVALGAPLGVFVVARIGRKPTLLVVATLCVGQFVWTLHSEQKILGLWGMLLAVLAVLISLLGFEKLRQLGAKLVRYKNAP